MASLQCRSGSKAGPWNKSGEFPPFGACSCAGGEKRNLLLCYGSEAISQVMLLGEALTVTTVLHFYYQLPANMPAEDITVVEHLDNHCKSISLNGMKEQTQKSRSFCSGSALGHRFTFALMNHPDGGCSEVRMTR